MARELTEDVLIGPGSLGKWLKTGAGILEILGVQIRPVNYRQGRAGNERLRERQGRGPDPLQVGEDRRAVRCYLVGDTRNAMLPEVESKEYNGKGSGVFLT